LKPAAADDLDAIVDSLGGTPDEPGNMAGAVWGVVQQEQAQWEEEHWCL
jgi:hypothetical protein